MPNQVYFLQYIDAIEIVALVPEFIESKLHLDLLILSFERKSNSTIYWLKNRSCDKEEEMTSDI